VKDIGAVTLERRAIMEKGERLVIIGRGGVGGPAAMLSRKLMPEVDVTIISEEQRFIVR
jgi:D-arabinose 1-dehydrogenase-like Zn-dependent alcohol dehydrogenase